MAQQAPQVLLDRLALLVFKAPLAFKVPLELQAFKVLRVHRVPQEQPASKGPLVPLVLKELQAPLVRKVIPVVLPVLQVPQVLQVQRVLRAQMEQQVQPV
jgi:hypothetical protein